MKEQRNTKTTEQRNKGAKEQKNKGTKKQKVHPIGSGITRSPGLVMHSFGREWHRHTGTKTMHLLESNGQEVG